MDLRSERVEDGVVVVTLDRPDSLNAITMDLQEQLDAVLTELEGDGDTRCLVLAGAGERAFSAGYDLHEMADWPADELHRHLLQRDEWVWHFAATPLPVVAALHGVTWGAGAILATAADVRCAAPDTEFRFTAGAHGGANATWTLPRLVGHGRASELLLTARTVGAAEAAAIGLVNRVDDDVLGAALSVAGQIAANPPAGTRGIKALLRDGLQERFDAECLVMRTDLRPRPVAEVYRDASFQP